jgi:hypothetical protein
VDFVEDLQLFERLWGVSDNDDLDAGVGKDLGHRFDAGEDWRIVLQVDEIGHAPNLRLFSN